MRGKVVDVDQIVKKNELTPAVGNARVNARGDQLGPGGKIIKKREDLVKEHYEAAGKAVRDNSKAAGNNSTPEVQKETKDKNSSVKTTSKPAQKQVQKPAQKTTSQESTTKPATEKDQDWVEDSEGNFVKKEDK